VKEDDSEFPITFPTTISSIPHRQFLCRTKIIIEFWAGLGKKAGNSKKTMGIGKTGFYRENEKNGKNCLFSK
jgi:hypothetical protein